MKTGNQAPNFSCIDHRNETFTLADHRGSNVLLSFHPLAWTPVCAQQMQSLESHARDFSRLDTVTVGVSVDPVPCKAAWARHLNLDHTPLLCDFWPHGAVAAAFGIFRPTDGFSERANVVVDREGSVAFFKIYELSTVPDMGEVIDTLREMP